MANIPLSRKVGREVDTTRMSLIIAEDTLKVVELLALRNRLSRCQTLARLVEEGLKATTEQARLKQLKNLTTAEMRTVEAQALNTF